MAQANVELPSRPRVAKIGCSVARCNVNGDFRKEFADFEGVAFLDTATEGPTPLVAAKAAQSAIEWKKLPHKITDEQYFDLPDRIRGKLAKFTGANAEEIAITTGASSGMAAVAAGLDFRAGDEVIVARGEFPAHFATWLPYQRSGKLTLRVIDPRNKFIAAEDYIEHISTRTRLVSASLVRFDNGSRVDAERVAAACHAVGAALLLDISQCAGAMHVSLPALGADFAVCSGYKWTLGPYGTGFFWVSPDAQYRLQDGALYWMALEGARNFSALPMNDLKAAPGARRWDSPETASFLNLATWNAALDLLLGIGLDEIVEHNRALTRIVTDRLPRDRFVLASPSDEAKRGPYVCVAARNQSETKALHQKLRGAQVVTALRENAVRIAPFLMNTVEDMARVVKILSVA